MSEAKPSAAEEVSIPQASEPIEQHQPQQPAADNSRAPSPALSYPSYSSTPLLSQRDLPLGSEPSMYTGSLNELSGVFVFRNQSQQQGVQRDHVCPICRQTFSRIHDLRRHERKHNGIKPFRCNNCGKEFSRKDSLMRHIKGDKSFCREEPPVPDRVAELERILQDREIRIKELELELSLLRTLIPPPTPKSISLSHPHSKISSPPQQQEIVG